MKVEIRTFVVTPENLRAIEGENGERILEGYAANYNVESHLIYENGKRFTEILEPGAFSDVTNNDVYITFNHSRDKILARTINKTLELKDDEKGLFYRAILNDTTAAIDVYKMVLRGDITENSFAFTVDKGQSWQRNGNGDTIRRISKIANLYDVSVVTKGAYPQTSVWARGFDEFEQQEEPKVEPKIIYDVYRMKVETLKNKLK